MKGGGVETFEPHFTFQGFRYVAVEGYPGTPDSTSLTGIVAYSDMTPTGTFESSNALVNRLQQNIVWGQRGNFVDVPTDCPQRDERMGWTGDAQVFAPTATFNMDVSGFFAKWLGDVAADQLPNGAVPFVVPNVLAKMSPDAAGSTGWADVATIAPWTMYRAYGDTSFLVRQYASMRAWVEYGRAQAGETYIWSKGFHFGDWLSFATTRADYPGATTEKDLIATAYLAHSADIVSRAAEVLGKREDAAKYRALFEKVRAAFQREFLTQSGRITSSTQTAYVLALDFDLVPDSLRAKAAGHLADDVKRMGHLTTGFLGTPALTRMLSDNGYLKEAYALLLREEYPSWLYEVKQGATTVWERWDGLRPDSSFQDAGMNSLNHYAYGAVGDWLYRTVAGLNDDPTEPGYRHVIVRPRPGPGFNFAKATLMTPYGLASSGWRLENGRMTVTVRVPPNAHGTVVLPGARLESVREGATAVQAAAGVRSARQQGDDVTVEVGSGDYEFTYLS
jgi:alpha-L-rhamnosidase